VTNRSHHIHHAAVLGGVAVTAAVIASVLVGLNLPGWTRVVVACWLVVPPVFFFWDLHYPGADDDKNAVVSRKDSEDAAAKVWAGVAAALVVLFVEESSPLFG
jgi:hypothetical protein